MIILDNTDVRLEFSEKLQEFRLNPYPELLPIDPDVYTIIDYRTSKAEAETFTNQLNLKEFLTAEVVILKYNDYIDKQS